MNMILINSTISSITVTSNKTEVHKVEQINELSSPHTQTLQNSFILSAFVGY